MRVFLTELCSVTQQELKRLAATLPADRLAQATRCDGSLDAQRVIGFCLVRDAVAQIAPTADAEHWQRDENGKVAFPYKPEDPIFGVSVVAASHYCSWLSEKRKIRVNLPEHDQWQRAAFSFDNGNVSAYGVADLNRNIRELLSSKNTGTFSRNIGFRYVMSLVKK